MGEWASNAALQDLQQERRARLGMAWVWPGPWTEVTVLHMRAGRRGGREGRWAFSLCIIPTLVFFIDFLFPCPVLISFPYLIYLLSRFSSTLLHTAVFQQPLTSRVLRSQAQYLTTTIRTTCPTTPSPASNSSQSRPIQTPLQGQCSPSPNPSPPTAPRPPTPIQLLYGSSY